MTSWRHAVSDENGGGVPYEKYHWLIKSKILYNKTSRETESVRKYVKNSLNDVIILPDISNS